MLTENLIVTPSQGPCKRRVGMNSIVFATLDSAPHLL